MKIKQHRNVVIAEISNKFTVLDTVKYIKYKKRGKPLVHAKLRSAVKYKKSVS